MYDSSPHFLQQLERHILARTGRRLRNLYVRLNDDRVVLEGQAPTYYVKQLAQHGVREMLPTIPLTNSISVI